MKKTNTFWPAEQVELIRKLYTTATIEELQAALPGKSLSSIYSKGNALGLSRPKVQVKSGATGKKRYDISEGGYLSLLDEYYPKKTTRNQVFAPNDPRRKGRVEVYIPEVQATILCYPGEEERARKDFVERNTQGTGISTRHFNTKAA